MAFYETVLLARPDIAQAQVDTISNICADIITKNGGKIVGKEYWGLRNLAYRMNKNRKAHYVLMNIDAPPAAVAEMERNIRFHEDVLRYLTVKVDALVDGPSVMMQTRSERTDALGEDGDDAFGFDADAR